MSKHWRLIIAFVIIAIGAYGLISGHEKEAEQLLGQVQQSLAQQLDFIDITTPVEGSVISVVDGDTFSMMYHGEIEKVRVLGVDTPELDRSGKSVECFGQEAKTRFAELLHDKTIKVVGDLSQGDRDRYDRLLRYVYIGEVDLGKQLIAEGFAREYTYNKPYEHQVEYVLSEQQAKEQQVGLWDNNNCTSTW